VIDLRAEEDFKLGHLPNAKNMALESLGSSLKTMKIDQKYPVVVIGRGPAHSQKAAKELRNLGYTEVGVLDGGIGAWQTSGLPLVKS
jgi:rhodanese-related sulfurtransferase